MYDQGQSGRVSLGQLVDALQEVYVLRHKDGRDLLLDLLRRKLGPGFDPAENPVARLHVFSIVMTCERHHGGLQALVDAIRELDPDSLDVARVVYLVDTMSPLDLLPVAERNQLVALLEGAPLPPLDELYREVLGPAAHALPPGPRTLRDVLVLLEQHNVRADGLPHVLVFMERLAALTDEALASRLRDWVSQEAERMDLAGPVAELRAAKPAIATARDNTGSLHLVMRIERDRLEADRFVLSHWRSGGGDWQPVPGEDRAGTLEEIKGHVADLVDRAEDDWRRLPEPIQLEFLLPRDLMHLPVDQWLAANDGGVERRLGVHFELVLRSLDRMRNRSWHKNWWRRWRSMSAGAPALWCRQESDNYLPELVATLADQPETCVVVLDHCLDETAGPRDALTVALREGVPVVLWCRDPKALEEFVAVADTLVAAGPRGLRATTGKLRNQAYWTGRDEHCGAHVSLLWDDPERIIDLYDRPAAPRPEVTT